jgi:leader peptidase (prepilin peptidase) / N-methyltransferase
MQAIAAQLPLVFHLWVFAAGAVIGSFLNVVIARVPKGESIVSPGSRCPRCKAEIRWFDNLPVLSWLILRARCRRCGEPISSRYPMVELLTAVLFVAVVRVHGPTLASLGYALFAAALVALAFIDLDTWLLPHQITWPLLAAGLASPLWNPDLRFLDSALAAAAGFLLFAAIALVGEKLLKRETMGWGDVWLLAGIGAWLGPHALLPVVMLSAVQGAVIGGILIAVGRDPAKRQPAAPVEVPVPAATVPSSAPEGAASEPPLDHSSSDDDWVPPKHAVPYGPFLALAALEQLLIGGRLAALYEELLGRLWA